MAKKILILGADGMAGHITIDYLKDKNYEVSATSRMKNSSYFFYDVVEDYKEIKNIIKNSNPNFVINCIGVLTQFSENNKPEAILINSFLPHYIDKISKDYDFKFIHLSTDCIFSGEKGNYKENDFSDATYFYGRTKSLGEINNDKNLTFRTSIIGPDIKENGIGLFNWFMKEDGKVRGFSKAIWTGVTTLELAKAIEKSFNMNISGLYHLVNNKKINKFELLNLFKKFMNKKIEIEKGDDFVSDKSLVNTRTDFDFGIPTYEKMIEEMSVWIYDNEEKYKNYSIKQKI